jgi:hypothetical protein
MFEAVGGGGDVFFGPMPNASALAGAEGAHDARG